MYCGHCMRSCDYNGVRIPLRRPLVCYRTYDCVHVQGTCYCAGIYGLVGYELSQESKEYFKIDDVSGILSLRRPLDRERQARHNVTIYAYDEVIR